ncbi:MAG: CRTAC1 family protein [Thermoanaerobaculia bacterium]|jgi:hypothetical protein|nr:CRTAC1 family protein [Thermoanaerobaculia bacterium]MBP9822614.1 CRTAC1 family protein [Thermoanaerobaculia bacterium]
MRKDDRRSCTRLANVAAAKAVARLGPAISFILGFVACGGAGPGGGERAASADRAGVPWFEDATAESGVHFVHRHGGSGRRYLVETMGSGGGFLDIDGDGWLDLFLLQGAPLPGFDPTSADDAGAFSSRLFRNRGDGTFEDITEAAGVGDVGYAMGACFGDVDNDGRTDIHVTAFGPDRLLRNLGGGRFEEVTSRAGIDNPRWSAGCAFADYDRDGCLDLYVVNYLDSTVENHVRCGPADLPQYCHPDVFAGVPDLLYRNRCDGSGTFEEVGAAAGIRIDDPQEAKGLGVIWLDDDDDGDPDIYVTNDSTRNFLFRNRGDGTFEEVGVLAGVAFNEQGRTEAGMGIAGGDLDGDDRPDLVVTNLDFETNTFYRNLGDGLFEDATVASGLAGPSVTQVGFGVTAFDADNDSDLDLFVANGHILDNIAVKNPSLSFAQADQLFVNDGHARFTEVSPSDAGEWFERTAVSRGAAAGDLDNDGDLDLLVTVNNGPARLLRNREGEGRGWIGFRLLSRHGGRDAVGAVLRLFAGGVVRIQEVRAGSSYLSQEDPRLHFGLGGLDAIERIEIRWPEGETQTVEGSALATERVNVIRQAPPSSSAASARRAP